jgi:hypothetical protein
MLLKRYITQFNNVLNIENVSVLIRLANTLSYEKAKIGLGVENTKIRNVSTFKFSTKEKSLTNCHWCYYLNYRIIHFMNEYLRKENFLDYTRIENCNQIDLLKYEKDNHYNYHIDAMSISDRTLSSILFLNNDYEGGELTFKNTYNEEELLIKPYPGKLVVWPSNMMFPHAVKPVKKGTRYTIVAWA